MSGAVARVLIALAALSPSACGGSDAGSTRGNDPPVGGMMSAGGASGVAAGAAGSAGLFGVGGSAGTVVLGGEGGAVPPDDECGGISARAEAERLPTDIIWAIDTSGSMIASFPAIQQALATFSQKVIDAGIDAHIILLAGAGGAIGGDGLCVPAPLGSGSCGAGTALGGAAADSNEPAFLHLDLPFGATAGMATVLDNHAGYRHLLRPNARTQLVLTEDGAPPMTPMAVTDHVEGRSSATLAPPWSPGLVAGSYQWNGVVCSNGTGVGTCLLAFGAPQTTLDLITATGGLVSDLDAAGDPAAADPFAALLDKLAEAVIVGAKVSCDYAIPPAPQGETFDRDRVNVAYSSGSTSVTFPRATDQVECGDELAWKYDDEQAPARVVLCPAACAEVQADLDALIDVRFGCESVLLAPQ